MRRVKQVPDVSGRLLNKGDTVATLNGQMTGRVWELAESDETTFVQVRPVYQPYGQAVWYASEQVIWVATSQQRKRSRGTPSNQPPGPAKPAEPATATPAPESGQASAPAVTATEPRKPAASRKPATGRGRSVSPDSGRKTAPGRRGVARKK
jgi:hypothetical protein